MSYGSWYILIGGLIVAGIIAILDFIKKKNPEVAEKLKVIANYSGYVGVGLLGVGIWRLLHALFTSYFGRSLIGLLLKSGAGIVYLVSIVIAIILGLFQAISMLKSWGILSEEKGNQLESKLSTIKVPLGFAAIVSAVLLFVMPL